MAIRGTGPARGQNGKDLRGARRVVGGRGARRVVGKFGRQTTFTEGRRHDLGGSAQALDIVARRRDRSELLEKGQGAGEDGVGQDARRDQPPLLAEWERSESRARKSGSSRRLAKSSSLSSASRSWNPRVTACFRSSRAFLRAPLRDLMAAR